MRSSIIALAAIASLAFGFGAAAGAGGAESPEQRRSSDERGLAPLPPDIELISPVYYKEPHGWRRQMDIYLPRPRPAWVMPVLVGIHGGGWTRGSLNYLRSNADTVKFLHALTSSGIAVVTINYGAGEPGTTVPMMVANCKDAVRYLRLNAAKYQLDPERIGLCGGSAGGHLAAMAALTDDQQFPPDAALAAVSSRVSFAITLAGSMDLTIRRGGIVGVSPDPATPPARGGAESSGPPNIWTGPYDDQMANYRYLSPVTYLSRQSPPMLIIQGSQDPIVPIENAQAMVDKAAEVGAPVRYLRVDGGNHTLFYDSPPNTLPSPAEVADMIVRFARWQYGMTRN